ncbi:NHL repeat containing protein [Geoanaerobacter pelophilus]|uniref:NHL repeat containing protein n=1 Tax=Geoanaerobacter pelophilus TaxID=60036 RepID=A0ABQ0MDW6_9BACT|nr:hypothetical protein [Geoanaerobacter pelophilus]GAW65310.1 NHL repeat containing protein [Geoanaerobacter pelophilus]
MLSKIIASCRRHLTNSSIVVVALLLTACAAQKKAFEPVFFPSEPSPPRIQYLMGISESTDVEEEKKNDFSLIVTGRGSSEAKRLIAKPYGITSANGKIYVCDIGVGNLVVIDPAKKSFDYLKGNTGLGKLKKPANVGLDKNGNLFVADAARKEIMVYNAEGQFVRSFGKEENMKPADVAIDGDLVYVLDLQKTKNEIKVFDRESGRLMNTFGKRSDNAEGINIPTNFTMDHTGAIYVTNAGNGKLMKFDRDGHLLLSFGDLGDISGMFSRPKGVAVDKENRIYIVDGGNQNVQVFNDKGRILVAFGDPGLMRGSLNLPVSVTVTQDNLDYFQKFAAPGFTLESVILVTNQYGQDKISVYGLGKMAGRDYTERAPTAKATEGAKAKETGTQENQAK